MTSLIPVTLEGSVVRRVPLEREHIEAMCAVGLDQSIWTWTFSKVRDRAGVEAFVDEALDWQRAGTALALKR